MIDLKFIRSNPDEVRAAIRNKNEKADLDALLELDETRRGLQFEFDQFKSRQNQVSQTMLDMPRGAKISGSGFPVYTGFGARLERAVINFMLEFHLQRHGYSELGVPLIVNRKTMTGTGQLPKLETDMYHVDEDDLFLIPTAEVPVTNIHAGEVLSLAQLPLK